MMVDALRNEATRACLAGDYPTAVDKFTQAIQIEPENHLLYSKRSAVYSAQSEYEMGLLDANRAIEIQSDSVKGWIFKGAALHGLRDPMAARNAYEEALELDPGNENAQFGMDSVLRTISAGIETKDDAGGLAGGELVKSEEGLVPALTDSSATIVEGCAGGQKATENFNAMLGQVLPIRYRKIGTPEYIFGEKGAIPNGPATLLEGWHLVHPTTPPPCSYRIGGLPKQQWKVFGRDGKELKYSVYQIYTKPSGQYKVIIVHNLAGAARLVSCIGQSAKTTLLLGWNGIEKDFDTEVSAVRIFGKTSDGIVFDKALFKNAPKKPLPRRVASQRLSLPSPKSQAPSKSNTPVQSQGVRSRAQGSGQRNSQGMVPKMTRALETSGSDDSTETSSESESEYSEHEMPSRAKKLKIEGPDTSSVPITPLTQTCKTGVVFKLVSEQSDDTRCFPMTECSTSRILFTKSRKFFRLLNADAEVNILSCRLPSQHERRHLFEGSEGEFDLLLTDVQRLRSNGDKSAIIEVKCVA